LTSLIDGRQRQLLASVRWSLGKRPWPRHHPKSSPTRTVHPRLPEWRRDKTAESNLAQTTKAIKVAALQTVSNANVPDLSVSFPPSAWVCVWGVRVWVRPCVGEVSLGAIQKKILQVGTFSLCLKA